MASNAGENDEYIEMEISALNEIGNILAGSYLSSLADFTGLRYVADGAILSRWTWQVQFLAMDYSNLARWAMMLC